ncbi:MAG: hypothetical protein GTO63_31400 [Anaerolineae bacterium]|nr:hypothetical protein [Anaerolineae bacterium]NIN99198.1 hypothetical protein [Anaerolineae bacterium]NIQ82039.1 hypothetical protein [Anaerolineae bacterium]
MAEFEKRLEHLIDYDDLETCEILQIIERDMNQELFDASPGRWTFSIKTYHGVGPDGLTDMIDLDLAYVHKAGLGRN